MSYKTVRISTSVEMKCELNVGTITGMKQKNVIANDLAKWKAFIFYPYLSGNYLILFNYIDIHFETSCS